MKREINEFYALSDSETQEAERIAGLPVEDIGIEQIATRDRLREMPIRKGRETYRIPLELIRTRSGFNVRKGDADIPDLAAGIKASAFKTDPLSVDVLEDGLIYVVDGHRRLAAYQLLKKQGEPIVEIECFINDRSISDEDRIVAMFVSQHNKKLDPVEIAACFMRLQKRGRTIKQIAERIGKSEKFVKVYLRVDRQPDVIKNLMANGVLGVKDMTNLASTYPNEKERIKFVEDNLVPIAQEGEKLQLAKKGSSGFIVTRVKRLEEMEGIFSGATQAKIAKVIKFLKGDIDEVDLVNL